MKLRPFLAILALFLLICGTVLYLRRPPEFKRYVSPPLPDGTRYTFLYPARMTQIVRRSDIGKQKPPVVAITGGVDIDDGAAVAPSEFQKWLNDLLKRSSAIEVSTVGVVVFDDFDASVPPHREDKSVSSSWLSRTVQLEDRRTRQHFWFVCSVALVQREQAEHETKLIADSFRVLRPGEEVP